LTKCASRRRTARIAGIEINGGSVIATTMSSRLAKANNDREVEE
jgi:hypothetical protein